MTTLEVLERRLNALEDVRAITELKHRYFRHLDRGEWDALRHCFTDDVVTHYENGHYRFVGIDEAMKFLSESIDGLHAGGRWALHLGHHPEIELVSESEARGRWTLHAAILDRGTNRVGSQDSFYVDEYRKVDGAWRISSTGYEPWTEASWPEPDLEMSVGDEADSRGVNAEARATGRS